MSESLQEWAGKSEILALVFTDIIDSTKLWTEQGNKKCIELIRSHIYSGRSLIQLHNGYEIKFIGDSFMVAFHNVGDALNFALDFRKRTGDPKIKIRAGIHVGQVHILDNDLFGKMVNYAKRVESIADEECITLSNKAKEDIDDEKDSCHSELHFVHYYVNLKGFDEPQSLWRVYTDAGKALIATLEKYSNQTNRSKKTRGRKSS